MLHHTGTITSSLRQLEGTYSAAEGAVVYEGSANAAACNDFAFGLRKHTGSEGGGSVADSHHSSAIGIGSPTRAERDEAHHLSPRKVFYYREGLMSRGAEELPPDGIEPRSPSSLCRPMLDLPRSVGSSESPPTDVAFGSGRPQRPEASTRTASQCVPAIGSNGDMMGIF